MKLVISIVFLLSVFISVDSRWNPWSQKKSWNEDRSCANGEHVALAPNGKLAECNPKGNSPCCSNWGWCGNTDAHCKCDTCIDYRVPKCPKVNCDFECENHQIPIETAVKGGCPTCVCACENAKWYDERGRFCECDTFGSTRCYYQ